MTRGVDIAMAIVLFLLGVMLITAAVTNTRGHLWRERAVDLATGCLAIIVAVAALCR